MNLIILFLYTFNLTKLINKFLIIVIKLPFNQIKILEILERSEMSMNNVYVAMNKMFFLKSYYKDIIRLHSFEEHSFQCLCKHMYHGIRRSMCLRLSMIPFLQYMFEIIYDFISSKMKAQSER